MNGKSTAGSRRGRGGVDAGRVMIAAIGAIGGALLTFGVDYSMDSVRHGRELAEEEARQQQADANAKREAALKFYKQYRAMGDIGLRVSRFIDDGRAGSAGDVRLLYQHFRDLLSMIRLGVLDQNSVQTVYGGDLQSLSGRFQKLASRESPRWRDFQSYELDDYGRLATALAAMMHRTPEGQQGDEVTADTGATQTSPNEGTDVNAVMDNVIYTGNSVGPPADFNATLDNAIYTGNAVNAAQSNRWF